MDDLIRASALLMVMGEEDEEEELSKDADEVVGEEDGLGVDVEVDSWQ